MNNYIAIIMAAGLSKRSGFQKLLKELDGKKMYQYIFELIKKMNFAEVLLVSNEEEIQEYAKECQFSYIDNPLAETGKASTIKLGCEYFIDRLGNNELNGIKGVYFFVCDQPYISEDTVMSIKEKFEDEGLEKIIYPIYIGDGVKKRGNPVLFPLDSFKQLCELKGDEGGVKLIDDGYPADFVAIERFIEAKDFDYAKDFEN